MKLFWTPASPFTRKVCVVARELGLWEQIEVVPTTWPHSWGYETVTFTPGLAEANPVARIPTLVTHTGAALGDSTLACLYLAEMRPAAGLIPSGDARWAMWSLYAIADGLIEAQIALRAEHLRPASERSVRFISKQNDRIARCFQDIEARHKALQGPLDLAQVALGVACGYQAWRTWLEDVGQTYPATWAWYTEFATRASMVATEPAETPQR